MILLAPAAPALAHDYWLEFDPLHAPPGGVLGLSLHVGEDFVSPSRPAVISSALSFALP